jgi:hypothetical protein
MADNTTNSDWGAEMNPAEHIDTYSAFLTGAKVLGGIAIVVLVFMAIFLV